MIFLHSNREKRKIKQTKTHQINLDLTIIVTNVIMDLIPWKIEATILVPKINSKKGEEKRKHTLVPKKGGNFGVFKLRLIQVLVLCRERDRASKGKGELRKE